MNEQTPGQPAATAKNDSDPKSIPQFCAQDRTELIVYVRQVLGFMPVDSLVLISVDGEQLTSVLRVNLLSDGATEAQIKDYLHHVLATCAPLKQANQLIAMVFSEHDFNTCRTSAVHEQIAHVGRTVLPITHAYYVGPDYILTMYPGAEEPAPLSTQILNSTELSAHLTVEGFSSGDTAEEQVARLVVAPWPKQHALRTRAAEVSRRKNNREQELKFDVAHAAYLFERLEHWDEWIQRVAHTGRAGRQDKNAAMIRLDPDAALELVTDLEHVRSRDLVLVLASFPLMYTVAGSFQHFFTEAVQNEFFKALPSRHAEQTVPDEVFKINFLSSALMASAEVDPDWARTTALNALLRELLPLAARDARQAILGLLAWSEWSMGRSSLAMVYLEKATQEDPSYRFTMLFSALLNTGKVSAWATRQRQ